MKVKLVYLVDEREVVLESMDFHKLDQLTYAEFGTEDEIIVSPRYKDILKDLPKTGEVKVAYDPLDVPVTAVDWFSEFVFNPFGGEQYMSILVGDRKIEPTTHSLRKNIIRTLCDIDVAEEFYECFKEKYTPRERLFHHAGMLYENEEFVFEGIKRIVDDASKNENGYFVSRIFIDELSKFDTVKNKDENGFICSPQLIKHS